MEIVNVPPSAGPHRYHPGRGEGRVGSVPLTPTVDNSSDRHAERCGEPRPERLAARDAQREKVLAELTEMLRETLERLPLSGEGALDLDAIEVAVQRDLRRVGGRVVEHALSERCLDCETRRPHCPRCQRIMEREQREREVQGLVGSYTWSRGYYSCRNCHTHHVPADRELGVGPGALSPALSRIAAMTAAEMPFGRAAAAINQSLGTELSETEVYRTAEALGIVAEQDLAAGTPDQPPAPALSPTLLIGADGTTTFTDGDWHEVKVGVVAPLGPKLDTDPKTGRQSLVVGEKSYCALVGTADDFFPRLERLARTAGWGGPQVERIVAIGDGGPWIWKRMLAFQKGVDLVEILDYIHASQHIWALAGAVFGAGTLDAHAWAEPICVALKEEGPAALLSALDRLRPQTPEASKAFATTNEYFRTHAAAGRMEYPTFAAQGWPIASGVVEAACSTVVCQRTKGAGKRWRRRGAQAILNLRCLHLSPPRWKSFFQTRPGLRRPPVATLRQEATAA